MFKVGQRVKFVRSILPAEGLVGEAGTVVPFQHRDGWEVSVQFDRKWPHVPLGCKCGELEPLADPKAEQFIERLKKLGNEPLEITPAQIEQDARTFTASR
jgi:hypothetical protein